MGRMAGPGTLGCAAKGRIPLVAGPTGWAVVAFDCVLVAPILRSRGTHRVGTPTFWRWREFCQEAATSVMFWQSAGTSGLRIPAGKAVRDMRFRELVASGVGVLRLAVDAGIALTSMLVAVPVAFVVGEAVTIGRKMRGQRPPAVPPDSTTHDLGTVVTSR